MSLETHWLISTPFLTAATRIQHARIAQYAMKNTTINVEANPKSHMLTNVTYFTSPLLLLVERRSSLLIVVKLDSYKPDKNCQGTCTSR